MPQIVNDTFTASDGTLVQAHAAETGGTPTKHSAATADATISTNRAYSTGSALYYYGSITPLTADYSASTTLQVFSDNNTQYVGPGVRISTSADQGYFGRYNLNGEQFELYKRVAAVPTNIGTPYAAALGVGDVVKVDATGTTITLSVNGTPRIVVTDPDITAAGKPGLRFAGANSGPTTGVQILTFSADESGAAIPPVNTAAPVITTDGSPATGETVSCSTGTWSNTPTGYTYQWQHDLGAGYVDIGGATSATYLLALAQEGRDVKCVVTATNAAGSASASSNVIVPAVTSALSAGDIRYRLSGGPANTNPAISYGGAESSVEASGATILATVPNGTGITGEVSYACIYLHNQHSTFGASAKVWIDAQLASGLTLALGWAPEAAGVAAQQVASRLTAPAGVTFTSPTGPASIPAPGAAIDSGPIAAGLGKGLWLRLTVAPLTGPVTTNPWHISEEVSQL